MIDKSQYVYAVVAKMSWGGTITLTVHRTRDGAQRHLEVVHRHCAELLGITALIIQTVQLGD